MNKKIRIIELLNKIANGEYPKRFKYNDKIYEYEKIIQGTGYVTEGFDWFNSDVYFDSWEDLNNFVEILEDNTDEIEEVKGIEDGISYTYNWKEVVDKVNELVRAVNELRKD